MSVKRILIIIIGAVIAAFGISLAIGAGFGGATLAILWQGVSCVSGMTIGQASFLIAIVMIIIVFFYDRKQLHIGTILYQIFYSSFVDIFGSIHKYPENKIICFIIMVIGVVIFSAGTGLYASAKLGRGSYEALTFALSDKNSWQIKYVRISLDILFVVCGVLLGGSFGACTICTILISGPVIQRVNAVSTKIFKLQ